jgi:hypothetical protein
LVVNIWLWQMDSTSLFDDACAATISYHVYHILKGQCHLVHAYSIPFVCILLFLVVSYYVIVIILNNWRKECF